MMSWFAEDNNVDSIEPYHIFLYGGAGVGKSFLLQLIEYLKRVVKYHGQNLDQPAVLVTTSMGKAGTRINGTIVHSAFNLPIYKPENSFITDNNQMRSCIKSVFYINIAIL